MQSSTVVDILLDCCWLVFQGFLPNDVDPCETVDGLGKRKRETIDETRSQVVMPSNDAGKDNTHAFKASVSVFGNQACGRSLGGTMEAVT